MQRRFIRLTESEFKTLLNETVKNVLVEASGAYVDVTATILRETERAYYISVQYFTQKGLSAKEAKMWCPKSCCVLENGTVTQVAQFVLDRWRDDYFKFMKSKGYRPSPIDFDMSNLQYTLDKQKSEKDEFKSFHKAVTNKFEQDIRKTLDLNIRADGVFCRLLGQYLLDNGLVDPTKCNALIGFGETIRAEFGDGDEDSMKGSFSRNLSKDDIYDKIDEFKDLLYGFIWSGMYNDYPKSTKYRAENIVKPYIDEMKFREGKYYKKFKKYFEYHEKFVELAMDAYASIP